MIEPEAGGVRPHIAEVAPRVRPHAGELDEALLRHGALLLRGFAIEGPEDFQAFAGAIGAARDYVGGNSPRSEVLDRVYTSTQYPRNLEIVVHNEMAYLDRWPARLAFYCTTPAVAAGITNREWTMDDLVRMLENEEAKLENGGRINRADRT